MNYTMATYYKRREKALADGKRCMAAAICSDCHVRIPLDRNECGWADVRNCACGTTIRQQDLHFIVWGEAPGVHVQSFTSAADVRQD